MRALTFAAAALAIAAIPSAAQARTIERAGCHSHACAARVGARERIRAWRRFVAPHRAWLDRTGHCESGSAGGYRLRTTGNGFWFRYQFTPGTWRSAGGRVDPRLGPVGLHGEMHPSPLEQDVRAVRALYQQGRGAWPVCG